MELILIWGPFNDICFRLKSQHGWGIFGRNYNVLISNYFNKDSFSIFNENFKLVSITRLYNTISAKNRPIFEPSYNSLRFGRISIIHSTTLTSNYLQDKLSEYNFLSLIIAKLKSSEPICHNHNILRIWNSLYIHRRLRIERSICDICNMLIVI